MRLKTIRKIQVFAENILRENRDQNARLEKDAKKGIEQIKNISPRKDRRRPVNPYSFKGLFGK